MYALRTTVASVVSLASETRRGKNEDSFVPLISHEHLHV